MIGKIQQQQETDKLGTEQASPEPQQGSPHGHGLGSLDPVPNGEWGDSRTWEKPPSPEFPSLFGVRLMLGESTYSLNHLSEKPWLELVYP